MAKVLSRLDILLHANTANYQREMTRATNETRRQLRSIVDYGQEVSSQLKKAFVQIGGLGAMTGLGMGIISAQREFDVLNAQLITATGSVEKANHAMQQLQEFAKTTPYGLNQAVEGFAKLKNLGLGASIESLNSFGNTASAMGKDLMQLIEAVADASTFEFERLKEFGIKSQQQKDKVAFTFQGITTEVAKNAQAIEQYLLKIGNVQFDSAMATRAKTLDGAISALGDSWQGFLRSLGNADIGGISYLGMVKESVIGLSNALDWASENMNVVMLGLATTTLHLGRTMISTGAGITTGWVRAMTGATTASIANAFSVQGQINAYNVLSTRMMLLRMTKTHYINLTTAAITATAAYARSLVGLATSFNTATAAARLHTLALAGVTTAKRTAMGVGILATRAVTGLGGAFVSLGRIITAHPIIALTAVIGAVIARTEGLSGAVKSLGDAFSVAGILAVDFVGGVVDGLGRAWTATANYFDNLMGGSANATNFAQTAFGGFFAGTHKGFVGVLQITARVFDLAGASVVTFAQYAWKNISSLGTAITNVFKGVGNFIASVLEGTINHVIGNINSAIDDMNAIAGMFGLGQIPRLGQVSIGRMSYGSTEFGFRGFTASVAQNNTHYSENQVVNAYTQVQQSAKGANNANLGLAGSMANVASASEQAGAGAKKVADANRLAKKTADEASKALDALNDALKEAFDEQNRTWGKTLWDLATPFASELSQIEYEIKHGKFAKLKKELQEELRNSAKQVDRLSANFELNKMIDENTKQIELLYSNGSKYLETLYDLNDETNRLSLASQEVKDSILSNMVFLDLKKWEKETQESLDNIDRELKSLAMPNNIARELFIIEQEQIKTLEQYNHLLRDGYEYYYNGVKEGLDILATKKKELAIQTAYNTLMSDLKTEEEKRTDTLNEQLNILGQMSQLSDTHLAFSKLAQNSLNYDYQVFKVPELSAIDKVTEKANNLTNTYNQMLTVLAEQRQQNLLDEITYQDRLLILQQNYANSRLKVEQDLAAAKIVLYNENLATASSVFDTLADFTKNYASESSSAYRSMFFMAKSVNLATAGMNLWLAASDAFAKTQGSVWQKTAAAALAVAKGGQFIAMIKAMTPIGQAHDGIMSVPKSGTWNLEKGERVLPKHTAQNLDNTLNRLQNNGGGQIINVNVTVNSDGGDVQSSNNLGKNLGNAIKLAVQAELQKERRQGGLLYGR